MTEPQGMLEAAFRDDHASLGRSFYDLSACLKIGDVNGARRVARRIEEEAWPYIAHRRETPLACDEARREIRRPQKRGVSTTILGS